MIILDSDVIKRSIEHYGKDVQSTICMKECANLIQAISNQQSANKNRESRQIPPCKRNGKCLNLYSDVASTI